MEDYGGGPQPKTYILEFHHVQMPVFLFSFPHDQTFSFMSPYELGIAGEELAVLRLRQEGMVVYEQRWRDHHYELDIIAYDPETDEMVFVEVKTRASGVWGHPEEAIDRNKIMRTVRAAHYYMRLHNSDKEVRFDVFAIILPETGNPKIEYFKDAFYSPLG